MAPKISVFLPSYNKRGYVVDAMRSVFAQTLIDWELWLLENSNDGYQTRHYVDSELRSLGRHTGSLREKIHYIQLDGEEIEYRRARSYITAWLLNVYYPEANGDYIFYLSDDDLIDPECFEVMAGVLDAHPDYQVVYAGLRAVGVTQPGQTGPFREIMRIPAVDEKSFPGSVDSKIDGGQIMHRKTCLDALVHPYFEEMPNPDIARHADGLFMERLVGRFTFYPIDRELITHRWTPESLWSAIHE